MSDSKGYRCRISINCTSMEHAEIMREVLSVDEELQANKLTISYSTNKDSMTEDGPQLLIDVEACDLRMLRIGVSSSFDMALVSAKTLLQFS